MGAVLKKSRFSDLTQFAEFEKLDENRQFVIPYELSRHQEEFRKDSIEYLSIYADDSTELQGYIILKKEDDSKSIEFRRIIIFQKGKGLGTKAIKALHEFCLAEYGTKRVWLDVFSDNLRGIHIYEKHGYQVLSHSEHRGRKLLVYQKRLAE